MADVAKTVSIIFQGEDKASAVSAKVADSLDATNRASARAAQQAQQTADAEAKWAQSSIRAKVEQDNLAEATKKQADSSEQAEKKADRFIQTLKGLATAAVVKEFLDANSAIEKLELGFTSVAGSSGAALKELDYVRDVAERMGLKVADAGQAWLGMSAATKGSALEGEGARTIFEAVTKQLTLLGRSSSDVAGALVQVQQGISKGKFELEDLKSLAERMPGFFDKFAESIGKTTPELFKLISSGQIGGAEFLKFAQSINASIGSIAVETFESKAARMSNAWDGFLVSIGKAGVFDAAKLGLDATGYAAEKAGGIVSAVGTSLKAIYESARTGDFADAWDKIRAAVDKAGAAGVQFEARLLGIDLKSKELGQSFEEFGVTAENAAIAAKLGLDDVDKALQAAATESRAASLIMGALSAESDKAAAQAKKLDEQLKVLGIDPTKLKKPIEDLAAAFEALAANPAASGDLILAGLKKTLSSADTYDDITKLGGALTQAFVNGRLSADDFSKATLMLADQQKKVGDAMERTTGTSKAQTDELKKQEEQTRKTEEAAAKMALELEKLASNERIKTMEFKVAFDIAQLEADTARIQSAFESINVGIESTGDVLGNLFGMFDKLGSLDSSAYRAVFDQIDKENTLRERSFELQKKLTEAQIENMRAQTRSLEQGDALIKIDGAGLQPHLEAFMWEILRTIQVRVNSDGLGMLLGVP